MMLVDSRKLIANFASAAGMRVVVAAVSFFFLVLLARRWSSTELGAFATLLAFFTVLQQIPLLGLHVPLIRDLAKRSDSLAETASAAVVLAICVSTVFGVLVGLVGMAGYPEGMHPAFWLLGASLVPGALLFVGDSVLVAQQRLARVAALNIGESLARTCVWIMLVLLGYGLTALLLALLALRVMMLPIYFWPRSLRPVLRVSPRSLRALAGMLALCPTFFGILVLASGINRLDFIMLSRLGTLEQVGLYSAPYKIYELVLMLPSVLSLTLFPAFSATCARSAGQFEDLVRQFLRLCVTAGLPFAIALAFLAAPLVAVLFGPTFQSASIVLVILAGVPVLMAIDQALTMALLAGGHERLDLRVLACSCGYYAIALAVLIPSTGVVGAAVATATAAVVQVTIRYRLVRTRLRMGSMSSLVSSPAVAGLLMIATIWVARPMSLVVAIALGGIVYGVALALLRAVTRADVQWILGALHRPGEAS